MARFAGFPEDAIEFFDALEANNERTWFQANKHIYEKACREPMQALMDELEPKCGPAKIFRINRDVRFSNDKSPYKTNIAASFGRNYVSLSTEGLAVGSGVYMPDKDSLARYRAAVAEDASGKPLAKIVSTLERKGYEVGAHDSLKTVPRGYDKDHPRAELLRHNGLFMWKGFPPEPWLSTRKAYERITAVLTDAKPLNAWFDRYVG